VTKTLIGLGLAAVLGGTAISAPAILVTREPVRVERVSFADLNLGTVEGRVALYGRIRAAARNVCERDGERTVEALVGAQSCFVSAVANARYEVGAPGLANRDVALSAAIVTVRGL
jgi:UrcA family protein